MLKSRFMTTMQKNRQRFYLVIYAVISVLSVLSLVVNIKTLPLIEARQKLVIETQKIEETNHGLELKMLSGSGYAHTEKMATEKLHMEIPATIFYIDAQ